MKFKKTAFFALRKTFCPILVFLLGGTSIDASEAQKEVPFENVLSLTSSIAEPATEVNKRQIKAHPIGRLVDGNVDTFYWSGRTLKKGDAVTITLGKIARKGKTLKVYTGFGPKRKSQETGDMLRHAVLEVKPIGGEKWVEVAKFRGGNAEAKLGFDTREVRLRVTAPIRHWGAFREVVISDAALTQVCHKRRVKFKGRDFELSIAADLEGKADMKPHFQKMADLYFEVWPQLVSWLGVPVESVPTDVDLCFVRTLGHPAHASGQTITINAAHIARNPKDGAGLLVHELAHVVQSYPSYQPTWFIEGAADYARYKKFPQSRWAEVNKRHTNYNKPLGQ